jgi:hypothetical protein
MTLNMCNSDVALDIVNYEPAKFGTGLFEETTKVSKLNKSNKTVPCVRCEHLRSQSSNGDGRRLGGQCSEGACTGRPVEDLGPAPILGASKIHLKFI